MLDSSKVSSADIISFAFNKIDANDIVGLYAGLCERSYLEMLMCNKSLTYATLSKAVELLRVVVTKCPCSYHYKVQHTIREFVHAALVFVQTSGNRVSDMVRARVLEVADIITSIPIIWTIPRCVCPDCPPLQKGTNTPLRRSLRIRERPIISAAASGKRKNYVCFQVTQVPAR